MGVEGAVEPFVVGAVAVVVGEVAAFRAIGADAGEVVVAVVATAGERCESVVVAVAGGVDGGVWRRVWRGVRRRRIGGRRICVEGVRGGVCVVRRGIGN